MPAAAQVQARQQDAAAAVFRELPEALTVCQTEKKGDCRSDRLFFMDALINASWPPHTPLEVSTNVSWVGIANQNLNRQVHPVLLAIRQEMDLR